jgi:hypothetical protein
MTRPTPDVVSDDPYSSAPRGGFAKFSLMYQTAREAAEAVSDDPCSSADQDAFEKALSVSLKDLVLALRRRLRKGEWRNFISSAISAWRWMYESIPCRISNSRGPFVKAAAYPFPSNGLTTTPSAPIIPVNQFRPATFQLPYGTPEELHRFAQDIEPDLIDQPSPSIYRGTIASHGLLEFQMPVQKLYESDHDFDLHVFCEKRRFQKEMSRRAPSLLSRTARSGNHEQSTREGVTSVGW